MSLVVSTSAVSCQEKQVSEVTEMLALNSTHSLIIQFLANVNVSYMSSSVRLSVVCNVRAPYSGD